MKAQTKTVSKVESVINILENQGYYQIDAGMHGIRMIADHTGSGMLQFNDDGSITYTTGSASGQWTLEADGWLTFEGMRTSFKSGCDAFNPRQHEGWVVLESSDLDRGPWD